MASLVTPFVGVWIETIGVMQIKMSFFVTPFVGVWIETRRSQGTNLHNLRHTLRGCVD